MNERNENTEPLSKAEEETIEIASVEFPASDAETAEQESVAQTVRMEPADVPASPVAADAGPDAAETLAATKAIPETKATSAAPAAAAPATPRPDAGVAQPAGPAAGTIVFGALALVVGVVALLLGIFLPQDLFSWVDPNDLFAVFVGGLGVLLIAIAVIWAVAKGVSSRSEKPRGN